ncbi:MAG: T9SS type A sorting domain-containing protein [Bacteroidetes bacterium]|nr:T9SS type A sorting domain-containing protein [Bacteroidota bacterium]
MRKALLLFCVFASNNFFQNHVSAQTTAWPDWVFKHWVWEGEGTTASAQQIVADYKAHNIPVDAIIIDSPWETDYNTFEWDSTLYPGAQAMIDSFHAQGMKVLCWATGGIDTNVHPLWDYGVANNFFMKKDASSGPAIVKWWKPVKCSLIDWYNPAAVAWWKSLMDKTLATGIDGWKCDGSDFLLLADFPNTYYYSPYLAANIPSRNDYSDKYYRTFFDYTRQQLGNDRVVMSRPIDNYGYTFLTGSTVAFTPTDIGFALWVGDQDATFAGMTAALNNMYNSDAYHYLSFGSDIGGYRTDDAYPTTGRSKELFLRWAQLGAFSGLMENGGGGEHRPWMFDNQTNDIYNKFTRLRYALIPYLMHQSDSLFAVHESLMQFVNSTDYRYMFGNDIFVAPVLSSSNSISVTFPAGSSWTYLFNNSQVYSGGSSSSLNIPLDEYPVFIKSSSTLLATLDSVISSVTGIATVSAQTNTITLYPNPATEEVFISGLQFNANEEYDFCLFDVLGRNLHKTHLSTENEKVALTGFANGVYYYTIENSILSASKKISGKVVVQK